jgi:hypothetical protein
MVYRVNISMLSKTSYTVDTSLFREACLQLPNEGMKTTINQPTGNFFYDPWILKDEYKGTVWETLYNSLPVAKGEARIIILDPARCYQTHADIDDRYHLNILGEACYLMDLVKEQMYRLEQDGVWYDMNAGLLHTATNFGRRARVQLVVRHLLKKNELLDPVEIVLSSTVSNTDDTRFIFDNTLSLWLNQANKLGYINNFSYSPITVKFNIEKNKLDLFKSILPAEFPLL